MFLRKSFLIWRTVSCWVMARANPRSEPSTSRRYRNFSPSVILQIAIFILHIGICVKDWMWRVFKDFPSPALRTPSCRDPTQEKMQRRFQGSLFGGGLEFDTKIRWGTAYFRGPAKTSS